MQGNNIQILVGRLGADAEVKQAGEKKVATFQVATEDVWKDKEGEKQKAVQWHTCELWGNSGVVKLLKKGTLVNVVGATRHETYKNKKDETVNKTKVVVASVEVLASPKTGPEQG